MKVLMLYTFGDEETAVLGDEAHAYGDNGGDPDGNCWLPCEDGVEQSVAERVLKAGLGELVEVIEADDTEMAVLFGWHPEVFELAFEQDKAWMTTMLKEAATNRGLAWAHYGAYGAMDSYWVYRVEGKAR